MRWDEQRDLLLSKAGQDQRAMAVLARDVITSDTVVGFHAQQAVEKYLKALLCHLRVSYDRTHDLVILLDALMDAGHPAPDEVEKCKYLQPYAVRLRYDDIPVGGQLSIDRAQVERDIDGVRLWVMSVITSP